MLRVLTGGGERQAEAARAGPAWDRALATRTVRGGDGLACPPFAVHTGGNKTGPHPVHDLPWRTRMTRQTDGLVVPPFIAELRGGGSLARPVDHPAATVTAGGNHHGLVVPGAFYLKNYGGNCKPKDTVKPVTEPLGTITTIDHHHLVIPYRRGEAKTTTEPLHTVATKDSAALVKPAIDVMDCRFRMFRAREHLRAQRFPDTYIVHGTGEEQTMQAGNAVSANVAHWIGRKVAEELT